MTHEELLRELTEAARAMVEQFRQAGAINGRPFLTIEATPVNEFSLVLRKIERALEEATLSEVEA